MSKVTWKIVSIKQLGDESWDALLTSDQGNPYGEVRDRLVSEDGFNWATRLGKKPARPDVQDMLTRAAGDMLDQGIKHVVL